MAAQVGGFSGAVMSEWKVPVNTVFCVAMDQGNFARVVITEFIGGAKGEVHSLSNPPKPPEQITLKVTLWKPSI
ncbi:hypothetical protein [Streptomyces filamentosus]|uniref:hypothetical protein n=1 Tax=Streptomyces filamentosus TaxID=67294 RepID=UPI0034035DB7